MDGVEGGDSKVNVAKKDITRRLEMILTHPLKVVVEAILPRPRSGDGHRRGALNRHVALRG